MDENFIISEVKKLKLLFMLITYTIVDSLFFFSPLIGLDSAVWPSRWAQGFHLFLFRLYVKCYFFLFLFLSILGLTCKLGIGFRNTSIELVEQLVGRVKREMPCFFWFQKSCNFFAILRYILFNATERGKRSKKAGNLYQWCNSPCLKKTIKRNSTFIVCYVEEAWKKISY